MNKIKTIFILSILICSVHAHAQTNRTYDGFGNNELAPELGAKGTNLQRIAQIDYEDMVSSAAASNRSNPREISNILFDQKETVSDISGYSDFLWAFGQFINHDISYVADYSRSNHPEEQLAIKTPFNDPFFSFGDEISMMRSQASELTGTSIDNPRQHPNSVTAFIDGSMIYGSDESRALELRTLEGGRLKVSDGNLLPWNTTTGNFNSVVDANAPSMNVQFVDGKKHYLAGDVRANENPLLLSMHTLFLREHNRLCDELLLSNPTWTDEQIYQKARKLVGGMLQNITYQEWLPTLGISIAEYNNYNENLNPGVFQAFDAAASKMSPTLVNDILIRLRNDGQEISPGNIDFQSVYYNPLQINLAGGIEPYVKGMATQTQQGFDCQVTDAVRNFDSEYGAIDMAALAINRGRDRGLPDYNTVREDFGLPRVHAFSDVCSDQTTAILLEEIYGTVDNIDAWVGMLAEDHMPGLMFGELVTRIFERQFRLLRDADRYFYKNDPSLSIEDLELINTTTLGAIIKRNTDIDLMQSEVFYATLHDDLNKEPFVEHEDLYTAVYPNPFQEEFQFKTWSESEQIVTCTIYDMFGKIVYTEELFFIEGKNSHAISISNEIPLGTYILRISNEHISSEMKILKI